MIGSIIPNITKMAIAAIRERAIIIGIQIGEVTIIASHFSMNLNIFGIFIQAVSIRLPNLLSLTKNLFMMSLLSMYPVLLRDHLALSEVALLCPADSYYRTTCRKCELCRHQVER